MIIVAENTPNHELVRVADGEPWVAVVHHPAGSRRWHVHFRDYTRETFTTRKAMVAAMVDRFGALT